MRGRKGCSQARGCSEKVNLVVKFFYSVKKESNNLPTSLTLFYTKQRCGKVLAQGGTEKLRRWVGLEMRCKVRKATLKLEPVQKKSTCF